MKTIHTIPSLLSAHQADGGSAADQAIQGPRWDLSGEYSGFDQADFQADLSAFQQGMEAMLAKAKSIGARVPEASGLDAATEGALLDLCVSFAQQLEAQQVLLHNLGVYTNCVASTDAANTEAKRLKGVIDGLGASLASASAGFMLLMKLAPEAFFDAFCAKPGMNIWRFALGQNRKLRAKALPLDVEQALATMSPNGFQAWSNLYDNITSSARCEVRYPDGSSKTMGIAGASTELKRPDSGSRKAAWTAINQTMEANQESFAAILNALAGWRYAEGGLRAHTEPYHYLDTALQQSRISRATLDTLMSVLGQAKELGRRALRLQARVYGQDRLGPWDILAPAPERVGAPAGQGIGFDQGLDLIRRAYASVHPSMGDFIDSMARQQRIEGRVMDGKRPGAYCTSFAKSRNPYVYTTYKGALSELSTLAHELGHAYHTEVMRDIAVPEARYPMTLAETASTFGEAVLGDLLAKEATDQDALFELAWADAQDAAIFLVNIPARFEFEKRFYEARKDGPLSAERLRGLMNDAWKEWYGDSLSAYDEYYWASKLHFSIAGVSFYNFPYSFGYLFSLGVLARKDQLGAAFHDSYVALLRDTGRMEAEELAMKHLKVDISKPEFWQDSIRIVESKLARFEAMVEQRKA